MKKSGIVKIEIYSNTDPEWEVSCWARLDTGAARTSLDLNLADFLRLDSEGSIKVRNALGVERRDTVDVTLELNGKEYTIQASLADRDGLSCPVLIGRDILT